jgi:ABC-2 type transport system permease protein
VSTAALDTMLRIRVRTAWKAVVAWVFGIGVTVLATTSSISGLYDTPAKIRSYADAVSAGDAMVVINGRVAGVDSLGGIVANEFGFVASFAIPFMAVALVARMTRRAEELGRLEMLLAGRIGRSAPLVAALAITAVALALVAAILDASLVGIGVPAGDALLYAASMGALGLVFAALAAVAAQLVEHARGVYAAGLGAIVAAYLLRGIGDVRLHPLTWLSPLGWQENTRAFGDQRWWPLAISLGAAAVTIAVAVAESARRDLGSARIRRHGAEPQATGLLRTPVGLALHLHRGSVLGWGVAAVVVSATFGALAQPLTDAIEGNATLASAMGATGASGIDAVLTMSALLLALLVGGYVVQAVGVLAGEEAAGRLEVRLAGTRSRAAWAGTHLAVVLAGTLLVTGCGAVALAVATELSTGESVAGATARAVLAYLPAIGVLGGFAFLLFGTAPQVRVLAWAAYAVAALVGYLGDPLNLPGPLLDVSPFQVVGDPPQGYGDPVGFAVLASLTVVAVVAGMTGFRRRGVPRT